MLDSVPSCTAALFEPVHAERGRETGAIAVLRVPVAVEVRGERGRIRPAVVHGDGARFVFDVQNGGGAGGDGPRFGVELRGRAARRSIRAGP